MALLNHSTKIPPEQTIAEIQQILSRYGVTAMMTEYDGRNVSSVSFKLDIKGKSMGFRLPCNWRAVLQVMKEQKVTKSLLTEEQAIRVAWRIILVWVKAQLALVDIQMTTVPQIFLAHSIMRDGRTLGEHVEDNPNFLLGDGS